MRSRTVGLLLTLVLSFSLIHNVSAQKKTDRELDGLRGPVRAVRIEIAHLDKDGKSDKNGRWLSRLTSYDAKGNKTEDETFYAFGKATYGKYTYKHDSARNLVEQSHQLGPKAYKRTYFYNEINELFLEVGDDAPNELLYSYDADDKLTEVTLSWADGTPRGKRTMVYDNQGRIAEEFLYDAKGNLDIKTIKAYDGNGRVKSEGRGIDPSDEYYWKTVYEYDDQGNIIEMTDSWNKEAPVKTTYTYEFDSAGNWIKKTAISRNGEGKTVYETYRIITYDDIQGRFLLNLILNEYNQKGK